MDQKMSGCEEFPSKWLDLNLQGKKKKTWLPFLFMLLMLSPYFKIHMGKLTEPWNFGSPYVCVYCGSIYGMKREQ